MAYRIMQSRVRGYDILMKALEHTKQSGAFQILSKCRRDTTFKKPGTIAYDKNFVIEKKSTHTVYLGSIGFRKTVAVKKVYCDDVKETLIQRELDILGKLPGHSNVVQFVHAEIIASKYFLIAYEFCATTLLTCVENNYYPIERNEVLRQATLGLEFLHGHRIIHRDLNPSNILLQANTPKYTQVKLSGFGLSKMIKDDHSSTFTSEAFGASTWFPPEVLRFREALRHDSDAQLVGLTVQKYI